MTRVLPIVILMLAGASPSWAQDTAPAPATVVTLGEAIGRMPADRAFITLSSETRADTAQEAQTPGNLAMKAIQNAVDGPKLAGGQFSTTGLWLSPDYSFANNQRIQRGYVGRHTITIRVDDGGRAGEVVAAAVGAGANNVTGIRFDRRDRQALEQQALRQAVQVARGRADALAAGAGRVVDRIVRIAEEQSAITERPANVETKLSVTAESVVVSGAPIASGEVEVRARVLLMATVK